MLAVFGLLELLVKVLLKALVVHEAGPRIDLRFRNFGHLDLSTLDQLLHVTGGGLFKLKELRDELLAIVALEHDAKYKFNQHK